MSMGKEKGRKDQDDIGTASGSGYGGDFTICHKLLLLGAANLD